MCVIYRKSECTTPLSTSLFSFYFKFQQIKQQSMFCPCSRMTHKKCLTAEHHHLSVLSNTVTTYCWKIHLFDDVKTIWLRFCCRVQGNIGVWVKMSASLGDLRRHGNEHVVKAMKHETDAAILLERTSPH